MQASRFANFYVDIHSMAFIHFSWLCHVRFRQMKQFSFFIATFSRRRLLFFALLLPLRLGAHQKFLFFASFPSLLLFGFAMHLSSYVWVWVSERVRAENWDWFVSVECGMDSDAVKWDEAPREGKKWPPPTLIFNWLKSSSAKSDTTILESSTSISYPLKFFKRTKWATEIRKWHFQSRSLNASKCLGNGAKTE